MDASLDALLESAAIWRARDSAAAAGEAVPSDFSRLDACLPGGGWPLGTLTELLLPASGIGELQLLLPALRRLSIDAAGRRRWIAWVAPPQLPYPPAFAQSGIAPGQLLLIAGERLEERLWATEQALRSGSCAAVLAWFDRVDERWLRRLKLAAGTGRTLAVVFRPLGRDSEASPATLRIALEPTATGLDLRLLKRRGGGPLRIPDVLMA
jgi:cell division inhibitor SulA/protein ImuA